jgi:hypothetical protein
MIGNAAPRPPMTCNALGMISHDLGDAMNMNIDRRVLGRRDTILCCRPSITLHAVTPTLRHYVCYRLAAMRNRLFVRDFDKPGLTCAALPYNLTC